MVIYGDIGWFRGKFMLLEGAVLTHHTHTNVLTHHTRIYIEILRYWYVDGLNMREEQIRFSGMGTEHRWTYGVSPANFATRSCTLHIHVCLHACVHVNIYGLCNVYVYAKCTQIRDMHALQKIRICWRRRVTNILGVRYSREQLWWSMVAG